MILHGGVFDGSQKNLDLRFLSRFPELKSEYSLHIASREGNEAKSDLYMKF